MTMRLELETSGAKSRWWRVYRRRRRARRVAIFVGIVAFLIFATTCILLAFALKPTTSTISLKDVDVESYEVLAILARTLSLHSGKHRLEVQRLTDEDYLRGRQSREAILKVMRADAVSDDALAVVALRKVNILFLGTRDSISKITTLRPGRVAVAGQSMEDRKLAMSLLKEAGFEGQVSDITPWDERSLRAVDLIVYIGSIDSNILSDLIAIGGTKLVSVEAADAIVRRHPEFESDEIPAGFISPGVPTEEISTVRVTYYLTATSAFSQNKVARLTEAILTNRQFVARELNSVSVLTKPDVEKDAAVRVHPGASAYINDTERTFLEQYSDFFWGALLLFSGLGSIGAWWRAFYYREQVDDTAKMRDQLLALVDRVRIETDLARLKEVEGKADNLLRQTLDRHEAGILDDTHLSAFGLALDHFRQSVTSRKIELSSYSPEPPLAPH